MRSKPISPEVLRQLLSPEFRLHFWSKVDIKTATECWLWQASTANGYGQLGLWISKKRIHLRCHKVAWIISNNRDVPDGLHVLHSCVATKACCNPKHLRVGTHLENMIDMVHQGRQGLAIFTEEQVLEIRKRFNERRVDLAAEFGGTPENISLILNRRTWKHI